MAKTRKGKSRKGGAFGDTVKSDIQAGISFSKGQARVTDTDWFEVYTNWFESPDKGLVLNKATRKINGVVNSIKYAYPDEWINIMNSPKALNALNAENRLRQNALNALNAERTSRLRESVSKRRKHQSLLKLIQTNWNNTLSNNLKSNLFEQAHQPNVKSRKHTPFAH